jgi:hypothetical protein
VVGVESGQRGLEEREVTELLVEGGVATGHAGNQRCSGAGPDTSPNALLAVYRA